MIGSGDAIGALHRPSHRGRGRVRPPRPRRAARRGSARPARTPSTIDRADCGYYAEVVRREQYDVDAQEIRTLLRLRQGAPRAPRRHRAALRARRTPRSPTPHAGTTTSTVYDVDLDGERLGRIYLDLHPREGKYKHAAQFDLVRGGRGSAASRGSAGLQLPSRADGAHERRHLVPRVRPPGAPRPGRPHDWVRFSGVATEWDFVEAPSQLLEEWAWDTEVLRAFATDDDGHADPGRAGREDAGRPRLRQGLSGPHPDVLRRRCRTGLHRRSTPTT